MLLIRHRVISVVAAASVLFGTLVGALLIQWFPRHKARREPIMHEPGEGWGAFSSRSGGKRPSPCPLPEYRARVPIAPALSNAIALKGYAYGL
jgi:hypothetical protein